MRAGEGEGDPSFLEDPMAWQIRSPSSPVTGQRSRRCKCSWIRFRLTSDDAASFAAKEKGGCVTRGDPAQRIGGIGR
jgi:hypothetical protein